MKTETIVDYENRLKAAMVDSDVEVLEVLLSDELVFTNHFGQLMTKSEDIEGHSSGFVNINVIELSEQKIKMLGDITVVSVLSAIEGTFGGEQADVLLRFTRIWQKVEGDKWQVVAAHSSTAPEAGT